MNSLEQKFLNDLDDKLWKAADKLRSSLDAANYKHIVLGLIFLKYVSDAFDERQSELKDLFAQADDHNIYYMPRDQYHTEEDSTGTDPQFYWPATTTTAGTVKQAATQANFAGADAAALVIELNAFLAKLKAAGIVA